MTCFNNGPKEGTEPPPVRDSLAELLYEISIATHDLDKGDAQEDDMGEAMADEGDEGVDPIALFREAQRANARENNVGEDEE